MQALLALLLICAAGDRPIDTILVCPPPFLPAMSRWIAHRESQGHGIRVVAATLPAGDVRQIIRETAKSEAIRYVVLAGDADTLAGTSISARRRMVPTDYVPAQVNSRWGSEPEIASDNSYADLDGDRLPDVAVGRFPASNVSELSAMLDKIIAYETKAVNGNWQRRVSIVAGAGGFGSVLDAMLETVSKEFLTDGIPPEYVTTMTYGNWRSPYCPDPRRFQDVVRGRLNEGCLFWVYIGHSRVTALEQLCVEDREYHVLGSQDTRLFQRSGGAPIAMFLSCYTGAFDAPRDCLAESLMRSPEGPVAVFCGSRVTMPYAMAAMGVALMDEYFVSKRETLGDLILAAKRKMAEPAAESIDLSQNRRAWLDTVARGFYSDDENLAKERVEHIALFNLLGDPLTVLKRARDLPIEAPDRVQAGTTLTIDGLAELEGELTVELVCPRGRSRHPQSRREQPPRTDAELASCNRTYFDANEQRWHAESRHCSRGPFQIELPVPESVKGLCVVRAFLDGKEGCALASRPVVIEPAKDGVIRMAETPVRATVR